ncbi:MAG: glycerophosphodiester phosphodiesterase [Acidimicrobiales bacterium]
MTGNPWLERRPLNFAHQGGAREAPSNTLFALTQGVAAGAHALEMDLHVTADRHLVVCHDDTVDRTTDGTGRISAMTLAEVQQFDAAHWWVPGSVVDHDAGPDDYPLRGRAPADGDLVIPTLRSVLEAFPDRYLNLDIKEWAPSVEPYEGLLADLLAEFGRGDDVLVGSFIDAAVESFSARAPHVGTIAGTSAMAGFYFAVRQGGEPPPMSHQALQVPPSFEGITVLDEALVVAAHAHGLAVHVWTIDDPEEMGRLLDLGVDGVMSDRPSVLAEVLRVRSR